MLGVQRLPREGAAPGGALRADLGRRRAALIGGGAAVVLGGWDLPHSFRMMDGVAFLIIMSLGHLPPLFALPAGLGDIIAGITAPLAARYNGDYPGS